SIAEGMIPHELDFANLDFGAFLDFEHQNDRIAGSNALVLRGNLGELAAMLSQKLFQNNFGFLDFRGVKLAFHAQADLALLEAVEDVRFRDGVNAVVANTADLRALLDLEHDDLCVRTFW